MRGITGVTGAAPIFHDIMVKLRDRYGTSWYHAPSGIEHSVNLAEDLRSWVGLLSRRDFAIVARQFIAWIAHFVSSGS
jgi:hypothetical protein